MRAPPTFCEGSGKRPSRAGPWVLMATLAACRGPDVPVLPGAPRVCTAVAVQALNVTVLDAGSRQRLCDAPVVAVDGPFQETLRSFGTETDCVYAGPPERAGGYEGPAPKGAYPPPTPSNLPRGPHASP